MNKQRVTIDTDKNQILPIIKDQRDISFGALQYVESVISALLDAKETNGQGGDKNSKIEIPCIAPDHVSNVSAHQKKGAMGNIDDLHNAKDEGHTPPQHKEQSCIGYGVKGLVYPKIHEFSPCFVFSKRAGRKTDQTAFTPPESQK